MVRLVDGVKSPESEAESKRAAEDLLRCHKIFMEEVRVIFVIFGTCCGRPRGIKVSGIFISLTHWDAKEHGVNRARRWRRRRFISGSTSTV